MLGLDHHTHAVRLQHVHNGVGDFRCHFFLNLQATAKTLNHAGQLGNAHDAIGRQIGHMGATDDRQHVVFAVRDETDVLQDHQFVITADLFEGALQIFARVGMIALKQLAIGFGHALWRVQQAFAVGIVARPADQGTDGGFGLFLRDALGMIVVTHERLVGQAIAFGERR